MLQLPDLTNAAFEVASSLFMLLNIRRLLKDKKVRGFDWRVMAFFVVWGDWNLYYYPHLDQWLSFAAGISIGLANTVYLALMIHYIRLERKQG